MVPLSSITYLLVKLVVPDLGEMLVRLSISSKYTWKDIATPFLQGIVAFVSEVFYIKS